jgi:hypothetical protein
MILKRILLQPGRLEATLAVTVGGIYVAMVFRPVLATFRVLPALGILVSPSSTPGAGASEFLDWLHAGPLIINEVCDPAGPSPLLPKCPSNKQPFQEDVLALLTFS